MTEKPQLTVDELAAALVAVLVREVERQRKVRAPRRRTGLRTPVLVNIPVDDVSRGKARAILSGMGVVLTGADEK